MTPYHADLLVVILALMTGVQIIGLILAAKALHRWKR